MKKGFLKCLIVSLGLILSLQCGNVSAKSVKNSEYKPKTQLVGLKKKNISSFAYEQKVKLPTAKTSEFYGEYKMPTAFSESVESVVNQFLAILLEKLKEEYFIEYDISIDSYNEKLKIDKYGNAVFSVSIKEKANLSEFGISSKTNSVLKIKLVSKGNNLVALDFGDFWDAIKAESINKAKLYGYYTDDLVSSIDDSISEMEKYLVFSLEKKTFSEEEITEINSGMNSFNEFFNEKVNEEYPELNINFNIDWGIKANKEYLYLKNVATDMPVMIFEKI